MGLANDIIPILMFKTKQKLYILVKLYLILKWIREVIELPTPYNLQDP